MRIFHQSRLSRYRHPYGARPALSMVKLAVSLTPQAEDKSDVTGVFLCYAYGLHQFMESRQRMTVRAPDSNASTTPHLSGTLIHSDQPDPTDFESELNLPSEPGLFFYWFEIHMGEERLYYTCDLYGDGSGWIGQHRPHFQAGEAHHPHPFQITLFDPHFTVPEWMIGGVIYQIFPDRFHRDTNFSPNRFAQHGENRPERLYHLDWHEDVDIQGHPDTGYIACDFFGGSLAGITEKLDYLQQLGVTILYLNPIFQARSNHRYDTGDYEHVDPLLGTNADLMALCRDARLHGIRVILDGVFSHTGADSRYFNKYGRYSDVGAYQEMQGQGISPYSSWYTFHHKGGDLFYDSWWGFPDLPNVSEHDLRFRDYITGQNGILRMWLRRGVSGFRLDVSDELPDRFLREIRRCIHEENADAAIIGEVWEDASHKISYDQYRDFLFGRTHDSIMGYPFQKALLDWLCFHASTAQAINQLETVRENYPLQSFYSSMNLISTHDIPRAITVLAGIPDPGHREIQAKTSLSASARQRGLLQMR
ncbi:MAG: glycoside hydrolase family 13 protein, partial [Eubacteriales bacterium]|nr:glycoside hydrolase family 13 protein [Eubacteriales bacterium]